MRAVLLSGLIMMAQATGIAAEMLPGFELTKAADGEGFITSLAFDPSGQLHYSVRDGDIYRVEEASSILVAHVDTWSEGNAALLGIAFLPDGDIITHHVSPAKTRDVVARVDQEGHVEIIAELICPSAVCASEHHGGNPFVRADGTVFIGIGDLAAPNRVQDPSTSSGKIFEISPAGETRVYAKGFRNPFDLAWDDDFQRLVATDNGTMTNDELNFVRDGENHGWPLSMGNEPRPDGVSGPVHVFDRVVAPTGLALVNGDPNRDFFHRGILVTAFVTRALYYFPSFDEDSVRAPATIFAGDLGDAVIDVVQSSQGEVYLATTGAIYRLSTPRHGDVNGDGSVNASDVFALLEELSDDDGNEAGSCHLGRSRSTLGADVNRDGTIDLLDLVALNDLVVLRRRSVRRP